MGAWFLKNILRNCRSNFWTLKEKQLFSHTVKKILRKRDLTQSRGGEWKKHSVLDRQLEPIWYAPIVLTTWFHNTWHKTNLDNLRSLYQRQLVSAFTAIRRSTCFAYLSHYGQSLGTTRQNNLVTSGKDNIKLLIRYDLLPHKGS